MQDLINAAASSSLPFEASSDGTYVCLAGEKESVYVVRNAWRGGFTVHSFANGARRQVGHYREADEAVAAAVAYLMADQSGGPIRLGVAQARKLAS